MINRKRFQTGAYLLTLAGAANFLSGDLLGYNPVDELLGRDSIAALIIYLGMGAAAVYVLFVLVASVRRKTT